MILHVIEPGETIDSISNLYEISADWIIRENGVVQPNNLAVGGVLVLLYPRIIHTIVEGDTLEQIAIMYNVTVMDLLRNNSYLSDQEFLAVGDTIVIEYEDEKIRNITVFGYCFSFIDETVLRKTLPYLTYLIIYSYVIEIDGQVRGVDDSRIIEYAKAYGVAPVMIVSFDVTEDVSETDILHIVLNDESIRNSIIESLINNLIEKGYSGLSVGPVYLYPSDEVLYIEFMTELINRVKELGLLVFDTIVPNSFELISDVFSTQYYIREVNGLVDSSILFPTSVGLTLGDPKGIINFTTLTEFVEYFLGYIESDFFQLGINTVGYMWELPYVAGVSQGNPISITSAIQLARDYNIPILFDEGTQTAYYIYEEGNREFLVRFNDPRSVLSFMEVVDEYNLNGIGIWNIESFFNGLWLIINSQYYIDKVEL